MPLAIMPTSEPTPTNAPAAPPSLQFVSVDAAPETLSEEAQDMLKAAQHAKDLFNVQKYITIKRNKWMLLSQHGNYKAALMAQKQELTLLHRAKSLLQVQSDGVQLMSQKVQMGKHSLAINKQRIETFQANNAVAATTNGNGVGRGHAAAAAGSASSASSTGIKDKAHTAQQQQKHAHRMMQQNLRVKGAAVANAVVLKEETNK